MSEETLYDGSGHPTAYIADDGKTIYTWSGKAVCYLDRDLIYGWNGKHLGWMVDGILYDSDGRSVGYTRSRLPVMASMEPMKSMKQMQSMKAMQQMARMRPMLSSGRASRDLSAFLGEGSG